MLCTLETIASFLLKGNQKRNMSFKAVVILVLVALLRSVFSLDASAVPENVRIFRCLRKAFSSAFLDS
jgi:hypothetical protein